MTNNPNPKPKLARIITEFENDYVTAIKPLLNPADQQVYRCLYEAGAAVKYALEEMREIISEQYEY